MKNSDKRFPLLDHSILSFLHSFISPFLPSLQLLFLTAKPSQFLQKEKIRLFY